MAQAIAANANELKLDFPGFAQEFLRRNRAYCTDFDSVMSVPQADRHAREAMSCRWGLCFPLRSRRAGA